MTVLSDTQAAGIIARLGDSQQERAAVGDMRRTLIGQVHALADLGDRYARRMAHSDPDESRYAAGAVAHALKVSAPFNFNGGA